MKSGKLFHFIKVQRSTEGVNEYGTPELVWSDFATLRAERVEQSTEEFLGAGVGEETAIVFRTRFLDGITNADRVSFRGEPLNLRRVAVIGRNKGLELRCTAIEEEG